MPPQFQDDLRILHEDFPIASSRLARAMCLVQPAKRYTSWPPYTMSLGMLVCIAEGGVYHTGHRREGLRERFIACGVALVVAQLQAAGAPVTMPMPETKDPERRVPGMLYSRSRNLHAWLSSLPVMEVEASKNRWETEPEAYISARLAILSKKNNVRMTEGWDALTADRCSQTRSEPTAPCRPAGCGRARVAGMYVAL